MISCFLSGEFIDVLLSSGWDALDIVISEPFFCGCRDGCFRWKAKMRGRARDLSLQCLLRNCPC